MPPATRFSYAEIIRHTLLKHLYKDQEIFWENKLADIALTNAKYHNRTGEQYGIHYLGKNWKGKSLIFIDLADEDYVYLTLHDEYEPIIEKELLIVVNELSQLEIEKYEASRFLSGLVLFPAPIDIFQKVLGRQLFSECEQELEQYILNTRSDFTWDANSQVAITTYIEQHDYILKAMNQRLLVNLITRDHNRQ